MNLLDESQLFRIRSKVRMENVVWSPHLDSSVKPAADASMNVLRMGLQLNTTYPFPSTSPLKYIEVDSRSAELASMFASPRLIGSVLTSHATSREIARARDCSVCQPSFVSRSGIMSSVEIGSYSKVIIGPFPAAITPTPITEDSTPIVPRATKCMSMMCLCLMQQRFSTS